jgi:hypothetical protein
MTPKHFPEANFTWKGGGSAEYGTDVADLNVLKSGELSVSLWGLSWKERLSALVFGNVWMRVIGTVPPVGLNATRSILETD